MGAFLLSGLSGIWHVVVFHKQRQLVAWLQIRSVAVPAHHIFDVHAVAFAMLESESPLRTRYVMLSLLFASRCALLPAPIVKLWPGFSLDPRSLFHCCKSLVLTPRREAILESVSPERTV